METTTGDIRLDYGRIRVRRRTEWLSLFPALLLTVATLLAASTAAYILGLEWAHLFKGYVIGAGIMTVYVMLISAFIHIAQLARQRHPTALKALGERWLKPGVLARLVLPVLICPAFIAGFATLKAAATMSLAYDWDRLLTDVDFMLLGVDPWVPLHRILNRGPIPQLLEMGYLGWQLLTPGLMAAAAIWMRPKNLSTFYCAMFATWIVAGIFVAAMMHSAGPIFAYLFDPALEDRFEPLNQSLQGTLATDSRIMWVHKMLALGIGDHRVSMGGGISAMPSVHVAVTGVYVLAFWNYRFLRFAALCFAGVIWIGSVYFGYHYVTDGPVGWAIAVACWFASKAVVSRIHDWTQARTPAVACR